MTQTELLALYSELGAGDYTDYAKKYLVPYWTARIGKMLTSYSDVLSHNFVNNHTIDGTITPQRAQDLYRERSLRNPNITSTLLSTKLVVNTLEAIAGNGVIEHLSKVSKVFTNYRLHIPGEMIVVYRDSKNNVVTRQFRDSVIVGIDVNGLITHFHGDATYGQLDNVYDTDGTIRKIDPVLA